MKTELHGCGLLLSLTVVSALHCAQADDTIDPAPALKDWQALAKQPDFSGVWTPNVTQQVQQEHSNPPPWKAEIAKQVQKMYAEEKEGRPFPVFDHCFPHGMPSFMLVTHNAFELLQTPGRVTLLGEVDGNRLRRIYTDGRSHSADPDPSFHGESVGHFEQGTLVIDTIAVLPQAYLAVSESVGIPNNGDMHIVERLHLTGPDTLTDELEITADKLLTKPWKTSRIYLRQRARKYEIVEGVCQTGQYIDGVDKNGNSIFVPVKFKNGVPVGSDTK
jgi:hypothetical protein